ncbi:hypothetical protein GCM10008022_01580 [Paenibacillus hunanensis]|nr:hypothetical protein GCM10008022_01580 [Paenibacillus hunanensis]
MKKQKLLLIPALSLAASLTLAPVGFASDLSNISNASNSATANQSVTAAFAASPTYKVGTSSESLFLHGEFEITITPKKYATFNVKIYDSVGRQVSSMVYSGSSPKTLLKSDENLTGPHKIAVTSNLPSEDTGTFQVKY